MIYKGILLDIDNTLYDYNKAHAVALTAFQGLANEILGLDISSINNAFQKARKQIHVQLSETASSHNRLLYIQRMLELLNRNSMNLSLKLYEKYWKTFLENMLPFSGVVDFLEANKNKKICLLTDLTAHIQHRKIEKLQLEKYADVVVTSEEAGIEKPHPYMFMLGLKKMNLLSDDVCMIGDSYKKDILGASDLGIQSFWLNKKGDKENVESNLIVEFKEFSELGGYIK